MQEKRITCISCPRGCPIVVKHENRMILDISGNRCSRGLAYARNEFMSPMRVLTSTVYVTGAELPLLPVKTRDPIPKTALKECMKVIFSIKIQAPVKLGDILLRDICGTGTDLIATRDMEVIAKTL